MDIAVLQPTLGRRYGLGQQAPKQSFGVIREFTNNLIAVQVGSVENYEQTEKEAVWDINLRVFRERKGKVVTERCLRGGL
ncbi:hypothetical protein SY88_17280 [Clostridiales bacterium PH28_bin88]|nr:hypothetical protein SY88_17280 [Clostridiales bacterium PH28_bin88]